MSTMFPKIPRDTFLKKLKSFGLLEIQVLLMLKAPKAYVLLPSFCNSDVSKISVSLFLLE